MGTMCNSYLNQIPLWHGVQKNYFTYKLNPLYKKWYRNSKTNLFPLLFWSSNVLVVSLLTLYFPDFYEKNKHCLTFKATAVHIFKNSRKNSWEAWNHVQNDLELKNKWNWAQFLDLECLRFACQTNFMQI